MSEIGGASPRASTAAARLAAAAILIALAVAAYAAVVDPVVTRYRDTQAEIADARTLLDRFKRLSTRTEALADTLRALERAAPLDGLFVGGESEAQAAARLQERIKAVGDAAGVALITIQTLPVTEAQDHRRIGLGVRMTADTRLLQKVFHEIESGVPRLVLDNVFVRGRTRTARNAGQHLDVTYDVFGFISPGGSE